MGNLSIRCRMGRSTMPRCLPSANGVHSKTPRVDWRTYSRRSSASMSCSWLFLGGLVSTRARLLFTNRRTACDTRVLPVEYFGANGNQCLIRLSQPKGPLQGDLLFTIQDRLHVRDEPCSEKSRCHNRSHCCLEEKTALIPARVNALPYFKSLEHNFPALGVNSPHFSSRLLSIGLLRR